VAAWRITRPRPHPAGGRRFTQIHNLRQTSGRVAYRRLAGYPIGIVSGLALGIDAFAHEAALRAGLYTLAVPGSGLGDQVLYPASNRRLADRIVDGGGGLLSELSPDTRAALWTFPQRNRLMAGMCAATLLIEAGEKSGTLITARMAVDYNRELLVVPGSIFSPTSRGCHQFLKLGATPVNRQPRYLGRAWYR
jgi:DNA processing protein